LPSPDLKQGLQELLEKQSQAEMLKKASKEQMSNIEKSVREQVETMEKNARPQINELNDKSRTLKRNLGRMLGYGIPAVVGGEIIRRNI